MSAAHRGSPRKLATVTGTYSTYGGPGSPVTATFTIGANSHYMVFSGTGSDTGGWNGTTNLSHQFLVGGPGIANLQIYVQPTSGTFSSGTVNTWLALTTTRSWTRTSTIPGATIAFRIRMRDGVTTREFPSLNVAATMTAQHDATTDTK